MQTIVYNIAEHPAEALGRRVSAEEVAEHRKRTAARAIANLIVEESIPVELATEKNDRETIYRYALVVADKEESQREAELVDRFISEGLHKAAARARARASVYGGNPGPCAGVIADELRHLAEDLTEMAQAYGRGTSAA